MGATDTALARLDRFLCTYPVRILKNQRIGNYVADYHCPLAGAVILLTNGKNDEARRMAFSAAGLTVLPVRRTAISGNLEGVLSYIDSTIKHALTNEA